MKEMIREHAARRGGLTRQLARLFSFEDLIPTPSSSCTPGGSQQQSRNRDLRGRVDDGRRQETWRSCSCTDEEPGLEALPVPGGRDAGKVASGE